MLGILMNRVWFEWLRRCVNNTNGRDTSGRNGDVCLVTGVTGVRVLEFRACGQQV